MPRQTSKRATAAKKSGGTSVQSREIPSTCTEAVDLNCTDAAIDESVQCGAPQHVGAEEFRKKLRMFLEQDSPLLIGSWWRPRAIVLPMKPDWRYNPPGPEQRNACLRKMFNTALAKLGA